MSPRLDAISGFGAARPLLDIEVTESLRMENHRTAVDTLRRVRKAGAEVAVDDFGTGYPSLAYLGRLPIHLLKFDGVFIRAMMHDEHAISIFEASSRWHTPCI